MFNNNIIRLNVLLAALPAIFLITQFAMDLPWSSRLISDNSEPVVSGKIEPVYAEAVPLDEFQAVDPATPSRRPAGDTPVDAPEQRSSPGRFRFPDQCYVTFRFKAPASYPITRFCS